MSAHSVIKHLHWLRVCMFSPPIRKELKTRRRKTKSSKTIFNLPLVKISKKIGILMQSSELQSKSKPRWVLWCDFVSASLYSQKIPTAVCLFYNYSVATVVWYLPLPSLTTTNIHVLFSKHFPSHDCWQYYSPLHCMLIFKPVHVLYSTPPSLPHS